MQAFCFLNGDNTFVANFFHGFSDHVADFTVTVSRDVTNLCDFVTASNFTCTARNRFDHFVGRKVDTALKVHRVHAGSNRLVAFTNDGLCQNGCGRGAVTSQIGGFRRDFANHLCAHVFELVGQFDFFGDRNTVLGYARCTEGLFDNNVTAFRAKRYLDSVCQDVDATQHFSACIGGKFYVFSSHNILSSL